MTIITKGMGAIIKNLGKKRKTLTVSGSLTPRKREVIIKKKSKPSTTKLSDTWQDRRVDAINRKIKRRKAPHYHYIDEPSDIYKSKAPTKKVYKSIQRKWHSLDPDQKSKIYMKKAKRDPKSFYYDKKKFGKK